MKRFTFAKRDIKVNDTQTDGPSADGSVSNSTPKKRAQEGRQFDRMPADKEMEGSVLQARFQYLSSNLPPDDVAIEMNSNGLLTVKEHEEYLSMKRAHTSDSNKSEYLLQCLGRRKAGFLTTFCDILRGIEQASYLADDINEAYKTATIQIYGSNTRLGSRDRHSKLSLSDPDLHAKDTYSVQECTKCKILELENKKLEKQCRQLKEQQEFYQTTFLPFKPLAEVAQDQIERALTESNKLGELLPSVQEAVTLTTCRISAVQTSLRKMNDMLANKATETKTGHPAEFSKVEPTAKAETIVKSETCRLQDQDGYKAPDPGPSLEPTQQSQEQVRGQGVSYELSQRRKSESAVAGRKQKLQRLRTVRSSEDTKYSQVDHDDSQLKSILKLRREHVEATADNINNRPN